MNLKDYLSITPEVSAALRDGKPVVALESTILSHGMPYPENLAFAAEIEKIIRAEGAVPAIRPSEHTVESRIPPRMAVRRGARLETPHIMMLADDPGCTLIEPIGEKKEQLRKVYEGDHAERRPHCRLGSGRSRPAGADRQRPERSGQPGGL